MKQKPQPIKIETKWTPRKPNSPEAFFIERSTIDNLIHNILIGHNPTIIGVNRVLSKIGLTKEYMIYSPDDLLIFLFCLCDKENKQFFISALDEFSESIADEDTGPWQSNESKMKYILNSVSLELAKLDMMKTIESLDLGVILGSFGDINFDKKLYRSILDRKSYFDTEIQEAMTEDEFQNMKRLDRNFAIAYLIIMIQSLLILNSLL